jgi:hypothetical protein
VNINFKHNARKHVEIAKKLYDLEGSMGLRATCLELRMAIEALSYELLQTYNAEVANSAMEKWQPKKVIDELLYIDPSADQTSHISFGKEEEYGKPPKEMKFLGTDYRFSAKWANKAHNSLGSYLHEPTIAQHKAGKLDQEDKIKAKIEEILTELEPILNSPLGNVNFGVFISFDCECGFKINRKQEFYEASKKLSCANCGRHFDYKKSGEKWVTYVSTMFFDCPGNDCDMHHTLECRDAQPDFEMTCSKCGSELVIASKLVVDVKPQEPEA